MKLGPILAALGGGALASLAGGGAAGGMMMSPLLMMLLQKKKGNKDKEDAPSGSLPPAAPINVTQNPMLRQMGYPTAPVAPPMPQQTPGTFPIPFGPGSQNPYGYGRY